MHRFSKGSGLGHGSIELPYVNDEGSINET
jgi:hypothetical protein